MPPSRPGRREKSGQKRAGGGGGQILALGHHLFSPFKGRCQRLLGLERIYQPLTHPYVLRRNWPPDQKWLDSDEERTRNESLSRLMLGLSRRCRRTIYLAYSQLNERGQEEKGPLLRAVHHMSQSLGGSS